MVPMINTLPKHATFHQKEAACWYNIAMIERSQGFVSYSLKSFARAANHYAMAREAMGIE